MVWQAEQKVWQLVRPPADKKVEDGGGAPRSATWKQKASADQLGNSFEWQFSKSVWIRDGALEVSLAKWEIDNEGVEQWCAWATTWIPQTEEGKSLARDEKGFLVLREADFSNNYLGDEGLRAVLQVFQVLRIGVRVLKLYNNRLGRLAARLLAKWIEATPLAMYELHLSHNFMPREGVVEICAAIASSGSYPPERFRKGSVPLWLRVEQNMIENASGFVAEAAKEMRKLLAGGPLSSHKEICEVYTKNGICSSERCGKFKWDECPLIHLTYIDKQRQPGTVVPSEASVDLPSSESGATWVPKGIVRAAAGDEKGDEQVEPEPSAEVGGRAAQQDANDPWSEQAWRNTSGKVASAQVSSASKDDVERGHGAHTSLVVARDDKWSAKVGKAVKWRPKAMAEEPPQKDSVREASNPQDQRHVQDDENLDACKSKDNAAMVGLSGRASKPLVVAEDAEQLTDIDSSRSGRAQAEALVVGALPAPPPQLLADSRSSQLAARYAAALTPPPRPYACPNCGESFTKWGLCQVHLSRSSACREALGGVDKETAQTRCKTTTAFPEVADSTGESSNDTNPFMYQ